jgi:pimeloyl-ACP methyl ester carboxylesterase
MRSADVALHDGMLVRAAGPSDAPVILFIHALADCGLAYTPLFATPLAKEFRLVAVDLPGCGASPRKDNVLTIAQHAEALAALALSLSESGPIGLVGHSVGSMIAVDLAQCLGERFGGLFSIEGNLTEEDAYFSGRAADYEDPNALKKRFLSDLWDMGRERPMLRRFHAMATMADARAMWSLGRDARRLSVGDAPGRAYLGVRPSLYYWSAKSTMPATRDWIAHSGLEHQQFNDASHWPMIDQPSSTAQAIHAFFRSSFGGR